MLTTLKRNFMNLLMMYTKTVYNICETIQKNCLLHKAAMFFMLFLSLLKRKDPELYLNFKFKLGLYMLKLSGAPV